ncbi:MAG: ATPase, partial [Hydrogenophilales bacterium CG17_big_fil_post_rev_8_21_14_2_50_63_12]
TPATLGERVLVTAIETLETGINLFANTLSFMRVAAFSLNHVALALAVFTIAGGLGTTGHGLTLFLGNVVIIVLEGGIVAIQALRLMYYEGFSRFFNGDGTEFVPLKLVGVK